MESHKLIVCLVVIKTTGIILDLINAFVKQDTIASKMYMNVDNAITHGFMFFIFNKAH